MKKRQRKKSVRKFPLKPLDEGLAKIYLGIHVPAAAFDQLEELCKLRGLTPGQFIAETMKSFPRWDKFCKDAIASREPGGTEVWPEYPVVALVCVELLKAMRVFIQIIDNYPEALEHFKNAKTTEWPFNTPKKDDDPSDWWKRSESL
jgi:hypothetical protein